MEKKIHSIIKVIRGRVVNPSGTGLAELRVEAWHEDKSGYNNLLGFTVTNVKGQFEISFDNSFLSDRFSGYNFDENPDVYFKILEKDGSVLKNTIRERKYKIKANNEVIKLVVNLSSDSKTAVEYKVSGHVLNKKGEPVTGQAVIAYDVDLRGARLYKTITKLKDIREGFELLGRKITDKNGYYEIAFASSSFKHAERKLGDVIVFAVDGGSIVGRSLLSAHKDYEEGYELKDWNVILEDSTKRGTTEYSRVMAIILPLLKESKLELYQLLDSPEQILFLANETEQPYQQVLLTVQAEKLRVDWKKEHSAGSQSYECHELFYGIGRQNIILEWPALAVRSIGALKRAIDQSIRQNIIKEYSKEQINDFIPGICHYATNTIVNKVDLKKKEDLHRVLSISLQDPVSQANFINAYINFAGKPEEFWKQATEEKILTDKQIESLQFTNQLSQLTGNHVPLIEELQVEQGKTSSIQLLELSKEDWKGTLNKTGWPKDIKDNEEAKESYITEMQDVLQSAYPTEKIALMIQKSELNPHENICEQVKAFFKAAKDFDFASSRVSDFEDVISSVANGKVTELKDYLLRLHRVFQVSPTSDAMKILLDRGLASASQIVNIPEESFLKMYGKDLGEDAARAVYVRATYVHSRSLDLFMRMYELTHLAIPKAIS